MEIPKKKLTNEVYSLFAQVRRQFNTEFLNLSTIVSELGGYDIFDYLDNSGCMFTLDLEWLSNFELYDDPDDAFKRFDRLSDTLDSVSRFCLLKSSDLCKEALEYSTKAREGPIRMGRLWLKCAESITNLKDSLIRFRKTFEEIKATYELIESDPVPEELRWLRDAIKEHTKNARDARYEYFRMADNLYELSMYSTYPDGSFENMKCELRITKHN